VAAAQVNVRYCKITSPVSGRVGVRLIDPGNIISTSTTTGIVSVNQITPIAVTFTVPQGDFQRLSAASAAFSRQLTTQAYSQETGALLGSGVLVVADNHVDQTTGTVEMKARFPNDDKQLWPGQFVNVRLTLQTLPNALTVPASAINQGPNGAFVYAINAQHQAAVQPVNVTATEGAVAVISGGLTPGQQVVTDGQMSLRPGATVSIGGGAPGAAGAGHSQGGGKGGGQGGGQGGGGA
jgi:membrane fusion protein, multidrug efflux system